MEKEKKRYIVLIIAILILVIAQQGIKSYVIRNYSEGSTCIIKDMVNVTYVENTGGAWGVGQGDIATFIIVNILVLGIIIRFIITQRDRIGNLTLSALVLILSGGISNFIDRIFRGFVVDYIDINQIFKFPVFNLEDVIIIIGWLLFIVVVSISMIKLKNEKVDDKVEKNSN